MFVSQLPGIKVAVVVDGQPVKEYTDPDAEKEDRTAACYIEAVSGRHFEVHIEAAKGAHKNFLGDCLTIYVFADGISLDGTIISPSECNAQECIRKITGRLVARDRIALTHFSSLEIVSDRLMPANELSKIQDLGCINVEIHHTNRLGQRKRVISKPVQVGPSTLSEKAVKGRGLSHKASFSEAVRKTAISTFYNVAYIQSRERPVAIAKFFYRSTDTLKQMLLIPRTPSPIPLEDRAPGSLSCEEIAELQRFRRERGKIKKEPCDDNPRPRKLARPSVGAMQLELDDEGGFRKTRVSTAAIQNKVVIELD